MLDLRTRLFIAIGGMLLLITLILSAVFFSGKKDTAEPADANVPADILPVDSATQAVDTTPAETPKVPTTMAPVPKTTEEQEALYVRQLARNVVERYMSHSQLSNGKQIEDIAGLVTPEVLQWMQTQDAAEKPYDGQTAKVVVANLANMAGDAATVTVGMQLITSAKAESSTTYKNGRVELVRQNGIWKVNGIYLDAN